jgi:hypothetical protein
MTTNQKEMFGELLLDKKIVAALTDMGFEEPSPIQAAAIPFVLEGHDVPAVCTDEATKSDRSAVGLRRCRARNDTVRNA